MANKFVRFFVIGGTALSLSIIQISNATAQAHVHGAGQLLVAQEDSQWQFEFRLPAADLLGFEHAPETQIQKDKLSMVTQQINDLKRIVDVPSFCTLTSTSNSLGSLVSLEAKEDNHQHDDHAHDKHAHDHDKHAHDDHDDDHGKHSHSDHDHANHADITMTYIFECSDDLTQAQINIFSIAPSLQTIQAQWITNNGQGAQEVSQAAASLRF